MDLPALGFGMGDVVLLELLKARGKLPKFTAGVDVVVLVEEESLRASSLALVQALRDAGRVVEYSLTPAKSDKQYKRAVELAARFTARVEPDLNGTKQVRLKNISNRSETIFDLSAAIAATA